MPLRLIKELVALYHLEPSVRDVFVEGSTDRSIVAWFLQEKGRSDASVREIDLIEVPREVLDKYQLVSGNRSRVIALGKELSSRLGEAALQATAIIDNDFDRLLRKDQQCSLILYTDYTCMEMYFLRAETISKFLRVTLQRNAPDAEAALTRYRETLRELFLIRAANEALGLSLSMIDFSKCLTEVGGDFTFDRAEYLTRLLAGSNASNHRHAVLDKIEELRAVLSEDIRLSANGHDFIVMLWIDYGVLARRAGLTTESGVASALRGMAEINHFEQESLFVNLLKRTEPQLR